MCEQCNYGQLLNNAGLEATANRLHVMQVVGGNSCPLTAAEIFHTIGRTQPINQVTVYRILELLVEQNLLERITIGGRAAHYGMAPNAHHAPHPHFICSKCAAVDCLSPECLSVDMENLRKTFPGEVERIEVRVEGICRNCLKGTGKK